MALSPFHPLIASWFAARCGEPTAVQAEAWPRIAAGEHLLACAPTGSGKTLAAFLFALDRLLTGAWENGGLRVLYVSPLKALATDVQRNLLGPLAELRAAFAAAGTPAAEVRVLTRTGDTPSADRQRMNRRPPEILITTPESLNILLTSQGGRALLRPLRTVILDEIHAVAGNKRGVHLMTAVERLTRLCGGVQRLALSATVRPVDRIAELVGGWETAPDGSDTRRPVAIVNPPGAKVYDLRVAPIPEPGPQLEAGSPVWPAIATAARERIAHNRSTLLFTNSRKLAEKLTRLINEGEAEPLAYAHHGSLSRELRAEVESRLKEGRLRAIVATSSLELGIDIGQLDEVLLVQTPPSIASAVQRLGRAGHGVGETSRGAFFPSYPRDLLDAAVAARAVTAGDIEPLQPVRNPLDLLAQVILSMTTHETRAIDELFETVRACEAYHELPRRQFDLVLDMLAGRYAETRVRALEPRLFVDRIGGTARAREHVPRLLYSSGGTIPDRGLFTLRLAASRARLGELDEEFVWERQVGDTFTLGAQAWRVEAITANDVLVRPAARANAPAPFWRAEAQDRSAHFSTRLAELLESLDARLDPGDETPLLAELARDHGLARAAGERLLAFLRAQRLASGTALPHRHHLLLERCAPTGGSDERQQLILHTLWGGRLNRPFALALAGALEQRHGYSVAVAHDDDCLVLSLAHDLSAGELFELVSPASLEPALRARLERSGFFGARFRDAAGRALLLPRGTGRRRLPLWLNRLRAKKLLAAVSRFGDFPIVLETWRTCLHDDFDLETLRLRLEEVSRGEIRVSETETRAPSPFAHEVSWRLTNREMYEDDTPLDGASGRLGTDLLRELIRTGSLRPRLRAELGTELEGKRQQIAPGYAPANAMELIDCVEERVLVSRDEWQALLDAVARDHALEREALLEGVAARLVWVTLPGAAPSVSALTTLPRLRLAAAGARLELAPLVEGMTLPPAAEHLIPDPEAPDPLTALVGQWLQSYGPRPVTHLASTWGLTPGRTEEVLAELTDSEQVLVDQLTTEADGFEVCDAENLESLLRLKRARARPSFTALPLTQLPLFLALHQGLLGEGGGREQLPERLAQLAGFGAAAGVWETELLPARLPAYQPAWLDELFVRGELQWWGCGREAVLFAAAGERDLLAQPTVELAAGPTGQLAPAPQRQLLPEVGRLALADLMHQTGRSSAELTEELWQLAWAGLLTNDSWAVVRNGLQSGFTAEPTTPTGHGGRRRFSRWQGTRPFAGAWHRLPPVAPLDPLEEEERNRERVRLLLDRYGVLFRELLARELPHLQWPALFRAMRALEWSGELLAGHFFAGVGGPQFASPEAFRRLQAGLPEDEVFWLCAVDPASPCGLGLELGLPLPRRLAGNHMVFCGSRLLVVSQRHGRELTLLPGHEHEHAFDFLTAMLGRACEPRTAIDIETINGEPALRHGGLVELGPHLELVRGPSRLHIQRRY